MLANTADEASSVVAADTTPLYVDLDGTLVATDLLWESFLALVRSQPAELCLLPFWILKGRSHVKACLADRVTVDVAMLPYHSELLSYLRDQHSQGRRIVLATASDKRIARAVADHLRLFESVIGTTRNLNCKGHSKLKAIMDDSGPDGFDYIGDSPADLPIWKAARHCIVVASKAAVPRLVGSVRRPSRVFDAPKDGLRAMFAAMRPHQWVKNLLVLVPLVMSHRLFELAYLIPTLVALIAFCVSASAVYLLNDLFDLPFDRAHPRKKHRPIASGSLSIPVALALAAGLMLVAAGLSATLPWTFGGLLVVYLFATTAYSVFLKRKLMMDVICLASLYTLRMLAGGQAAGITITPWLMAFSMFFFLSLAFVKRYTELDMQQDRVGKIDGRGYHATDIEMIRSLGPASGYVSILVVALYINGPDVQHLYHRPWLIWLICPILLYWISRVWLLAHRHQMPHDPVLFSLRDNQSYLAGFLVGLILLAAV